MRASKLPGKDPFHDLYGVPALAGKSSELRYATKFWPVEQSHASPPEGGTPNRGAATAGAQVLRKSLQIGSTMHLCFDALCARDGSRYAPFLPCAIIILSILLPAHAEEKITYQDNILPLVEANCAKCHNADKKKADLDLTSYQGALKGSGSGVVLLSGNPDASKLWKALTHAEEPYMPPNRPRLDDQELQIFK